VGSTARAVNRSTRFYKLLGLPWRVADQITKLTFLNLSTLKFLKHLMVFLQFPHKFICRRWYIHHISSISAEYHPQWLIIILSGCLFSHVNLYQTLSYMIFFPLGWMSSYWLENQLLWMNTTNEGRLLESNIICCWWILSNISDYRP
jgi:hypothetical protein